MTERRFRYRTNWRGKLILQVGETYTDYLIGGIVIPALHWRDATTQDLTERERPL